MEKNKFKDQVIQYFQKYYAKRKKVPSSRELFKSFNKTRFYEVFPQGLAQACKAAGIPVPEERLKQTRKARQTAKKKRVREASETEDSDTDQRGQVEIFKQSLEKEKELRSLRKKKAEELAKAVKLIALDPNPEINGPMLKALEKVVPRILKDRYGISLSFWAIRQLNEITGGDLSFENVRKMAEYSKLSDEQKQALNDLVGKLDEMTLYEIAKYAALSDEDKEAVRVLIAYSAKKGMTPMQAMVHLDMVKRFKEGGAEAFIRGPW